MSQRCAVCDYTADRNLNNMPYKGKADRKVLWNPKHNEFQCTSCARSIKETARTDYRINKPRF